MRYRDLFFYSGMTAIACLLWALRGCALDMGAILLLAVAGLLSLAVLLRREKRRK